MPLTKASPDVIQGLFRRNLIINGDFDLWQRGTTVTQAGNTNHQYLADRFFIEGTAGYTYTMEQNTDVPAGSAALEHGRRERAARLIDVVARPRPRRDDRRDLRRVGARLPFRLADGAPEHRRVTGHGCHAKG